MDMLLSLIHIFYQTSTNIFNPQNKKITFMEWSVWWIPYLFCAIHLIPHRILESKDESRQVPRMSLQLNCLLWLYRPVQILQKWFRLSNECKLYMLWDSTRVTKAASRDDSKHWEHMSISFPNKRSQVFTIMRVLLVNPKDGIQPKSVPDSFSSYKNQYLNMMGFKQ